MKAGVQGPLPLLQDVVQGLLHQSLPVLHEPNLSMMCGVAARHMTDMAAYLIALQTTGPPLWGCFAALQPSSASYIWCRALSINRHAHMHRDAFLPATARPLSASTCTVQASTHQSLLPLSLSVLQESGPYSGFQPAGKLGGKRWTRGTQAAPAPTRRCLASLLVQTELHPAPHLHTGQA